MFDAVEQGLLDVINRTKGTAFTGPQLLADCQARSGSEEVYQQSYMCNPLGTATNHIVDWSAIELCRYDYEIIRAHFEHSQIVQQFGAFHPDREQQRQQAIADFIHKEFLPLFQSKDRYRLGFDVAASGQGHLGAIYIDQAIGSELWLRGLLTTHTEDWDFIATLLHCFLGELYNVMGAGDETGLGREICWYMAEHFPSRFLKVNFSSKKHDLSFSLMNQLATAQKRFPKSQQDIAADYFALRKAYQASRWVFSESSNSLNPASHCDVAWAGALATHAHTQRKEEAWALVG
jgi:phage FluMu gp28-like protein